MLKKIGETVKKYWHIVALFVGGIVFFLLRKDVPNIHDDLAKLKKIREDEAKKIEAARAEQALKHAENVKKYQVETANIKGEFVEKRAELEKKKAKETNGLSKHSAEELADVVSSVTGFKVIKPKDDQSN